MNKLLEKLGFNPKEVEVYMALLEFGNNPASVIAKKTGYPKSTVLFLFDHLVKRGYVRKSQRGRIQYFFADPQDLKKAKRLEIENENKALSKVIPLLDEFKTPYSSEPKVTFFEGIEGCKQAYSLILESKTEVLEFGAHDDLAKKFGEAFMNDFIRKRAKNKVFLKAVCKKTPVHKKLHEVDKKQSREIQFYPLSKGDLYSSIAIFEDKVLLLNLYQDAFAILIQNTEVANSLKTIHRIIWN